MSHLPIADYALLSDCRSAALVSREGSVDWLCFPRFDGPSVFGRLLDDARRPLVDPPAGRRADVSRRYVDDTMVLETTFRTSTGHRRAHRRAGRGPQRAGPRARRRRAAACCCAG